MFAGILGKKTSEGIFATAAREVKDATIKHLLDPETGMFYKMIHFSDSGEVIADKTPDISSVYGLYTFGAMHPDDPILERAVHETLKHTMVKTEVPGIARYAGDKYWTVDHSTAGNPWFITTLWLAEFVTMKARSEKDLEETKHWLFWAARHALSSGVMSEQLNPHNGDHISATPLAWSHSEFVLVVLSYLDKLEELGICPACNPVK
jgi:GH15 family glucan-1,4-alpha-glucosidase